MNSSFIDAVNKIIAPLKRRIMMIVVRGVVKTIKQSALQQVQITALADETLDKLEYIEPYGFTSVPGDGAEAVALFMGGNRDHGVILSIADRRYRIKTLAQDDVALYHKDGTKIVLKGNGKFQITNPAGFEWVALQSRLLLFLINARTMTAFGPQPLFDSTEMDTLVQLKIDIDTFKV